MKTHNTPWLNLLLVIGLLGWTASGVAGISSTKHNLSISGPGTYKATSESQLCIYCHYPHNANPAAPLWNHTLSSATYTPYSSLTLAAAAPGQPTGASKLCLSCHDGTVALGSVHNRPFGAGSGTITGLAGFLIGEANLGTDLRDDHPISFTYDVSLVATNPELVSPATLTGKIKPDGNNQLQCTSCHEPHSDINPKFMHTAYKDGAGYGSPLCKTCHNKTYWNTVTNNSHRESLAQWNGTGTNPWHIAGQNLANNANSTVKANGCENCHKPHTAPNNRNLKGTSTSGICLTCHNGNVASAAKNIDAAFNKLYTHPTKDAARAGRHDPKRLSGNVREEQATLNNRHAECADCHNPHAVSAGVSPSIPAVTNNLTSNVLKGVWGVQPTWPGNWGTVTTYNVVDDTQYQYELCLKCHSYYAFGLSPPVDPYGKIPSTSKLLTDQAQEFNPNNASYHPVVGVGKNTFTMVVGGTPRDYSASLINGMTPTTVFGCVECHSNADPAGTGPKGPHGSDVWPILWGPYDGTTGMSGGWGSWGTSTSNHLCFRCHDYAKYTNSTYTMQPYTTGFSNGSKNLHAYHVGRKDAPCISCHSGIPHGWMRKRMLVFGRTLASDPGADPAPYNSHGTYKFDGNSDYGIPSNVGSARGKTLDTITSGNWQQNDCHSGVPVIGVGACN